MMEKLLEMANKSNDAAEVYSLEHTMNLINYENGRLKNIRSRIHSGVSLRIIKDGLLGFAYTKNLTDREELMNNALGTLKGGVKVAFEFPYAKDIPALDTYDASVESLTNTQIVNECDRICENLSAQADGQINVIAGNGLNTIRIINSAGTDMSLKLSRYYCAASMLFPHSYAAIHKLHYAKKFEKFPQEHLEYVSRMYKQTRPEVQIKGGRYKVLFMPESINVLLSRLMKATSGQTVYQQESPITDRIGDKLFDAKLSVYDDPLNDMRPDARPFDDEGTPTQVLPIVEKGVLKNFYYDLNYAAKMKTAPTGHGYKTAAWSSETIASVPYPAPMHPTVRPGNVSFTDMLNMMDKGVIVCGALGAHSGNVTNGDFSIGLSPGIYVEKGEIKGRVKDAMVAGNIYDIMTDVLAIEDMVHATPRGRFPAILLDNVSVATKK